MITCQKENFWLVSMSNHKNASNMTTSVFDHCSFCDDGRWAINWSLVQGRHALLLLLTTSIISVTVKIHFLTACQDLDTSHTNEDLKLKLKKENVHVM